MVRARTGCSAAPSSATRGSACIPPAAYAPKIQVIHEGIDTAHLRPDPAARLTLPDGTLLHAGEPIVTYVARNLEPYRGFHVFMRALQRLQQRHPRCRAVIVGGDAVSYGARPHGAANWRQKMLQEVQLDPARTHFTGRLPYARYRTLLQVSAVHVHLTYPFVLSWSMLEAMSCGCLLVASDVAPVREFVSEGRNGLLVEVGGTRLQIAARRLEAVHGGCRGEPATLAAGHRQRHRQEDRQPQQGPVPPLEGHRPFGRVEVGRSAPWGSPRFRRRPRRSPAGAPPAPTRGPGKCRSAVAAGRCTDGPNHGTAA